MATTTTTTSTLLTSPIPNSSSPLLQHQQSFHDVTTSKTPGGVRAALRQLHIQQAEQTARLDALLASHDKLSRDLNRLDLSRARLGSLSVNVRSISNNMLSGAAATAGQISQAVQRLDLEQARVVSTLEVVEQVATLKACVLGVVGSMGAPQDWETAAEYISRASLIPREVIDSGFAQEVVPTEEVPDAPGVTLDTAAQSLCRLFLREFEKAVEEKDGARVTRFFKMFPLIGRSKEGLDAYAKYVCQGVAARARATLQSSAMSQQRENYFYASALTRLFEHIAQVVDGHSSLVELHYGPSTMVNVMARLHGEADVQGGIILDTWTEERAIDRKLTEVKSYAFSFLVQSFLPAQRAGFGTPSRTASPAPGARNPAYAQQEENVDMKEVDHVLNELIAMLGRWSLYLRFVSSRVAESENAGSTQKDQNLATPQFLANSNLPKKVAKLLVEPFSSFATYFFRRSVEKAFQLDETPQGLTLNPQKPITTNPPFITSAVDDVMFIVNQVLQKTLATSHASLVTAMIATIGRVLGSDFIGMIQRKMRDESYPKAAIAGAMPPEEKVVAFLVLINNLDIATQYINRIVRTHSHQASNAAGQPQDFDQRATSRPLSDLFPMHRDATAVSNALAALETSFSSKASELIYDGIAVTFQQVIKPRMRPMLADSFRDVDYSLTDTSNTDTLASDDEDNPTTTVKHRTQTQWDALVKPMRKILSQRNFDRILSTTTNDLSNLLEKRIWSYHGRVSEFGAVRLERDVVEVINVAVRGEHFKLREPFARCLQIVSIMNMEEEEWEGLRVGGDDEMDAGIEWALSETERQRARSMVRRRE